MHFNKALYSEENKKNVGNDSFYVNEARQIINKYAGMIRKNILKSDELFGQVVSDLMLADWRWNKNREKSSSKSSYRVYCGIKSIQIIKKNILNPKNKNVSLNNIDKACNKNDILNVENKEYINNLLSKLTDIQEQCIRMYYFDGLKQGEIAEILSCSHQAVSQNIDRGIKKLRELV